MSDDDLPSTLDLSVGDVRSFELLGLGTAGYIWQEIVEGPPVVEITWQRGFPPGTPLPLVGVSAPEILTVRAVSPGEATLRVVQHRPWEKDVAPKREHATLVRVHPQPG